MIGALMIEKRGRKRKSGARYPSGGLRREKIEEPNVVALRMPHRMGVPKELAHDAKAETVLGRYSLNGLITPLEYDAGVYYRGVVARYLSSIGAPKSDVPSCTGEAMSRGVAGEYDLAEAERRKSAYDQAYEAVEEGGGQRGAKALSRVAVYDERCPNGLFQQMRYSLVGLMLVRGLCTSTHALDLRRKIGVS